MKIISAKRVELAVVRMKQINKSQGLVARYLKRELSKESASSGSLYISRVSLHPESCQCVAHISKCVRVCALWASERASDQPQSLAPKTIIVRLMSAISAGKNGE